MSTRFDWTADVSAPEGGRESQRKDYDVNNETENGGTTGASNNTGELWELIEIMGHQRIAGRVSEVERFGEIFMQVDVPEVDGRPAYRKHYSGKAIFSTTVLTKDLVVAYLRRERWAVPNPILQLAAPDATVVPRDAEEVGPVGDNEDESFDEDGADAGLEDA